MSDGTQPTDKSIGGIIDHVTKDDGTGPNQPGLPGGPAGNVVPYNNLMGVPQPIVDLGNGIAPAPGTHATTHKVGGSDNLTSLLSVANGVPQSGGTGKLDISWFPLGDTSTTVVVGNDTRFTEAGLVAHKNKHTYPSGTDRFVPTDVLDCSVRGSAGSAYYSD